MLVLVDLGPARRLREPIERLGVGGDPRVERLLEAAVVLDLERRRAARWPAARGRRSPVRAGLRARPPWRAGRRRRRPPGAGTATPSPAPARARSRSCRRGSVRLCSSSAARLIASLIERCDALNVAIALSSEPRRMAFICPSAPSSTAPPGSRCAVSCPSAEATVSSWRAISLRSSCDDRARIQLAHLGSEGVAEGLRGLHQLLELDALLRAERCLPEEVVVREGVARLDAGRRVDRLALAGRLDLAGAQQREDQQANDLEVPAERLLGELVGEEATARRVAVVGALLDAARAPPSSGPLSTRKTVLPFSSRRRPRLPNTEGRPWRFSAVKSASTPFFTSADFAAASLKRSKTSGSTCPRISAALLPTSTARSPGLRSLPRK